MLCFVYLLKVLSEETHIKIDPSVEPPLEDRQMVAISMCPAVQEDAAVNDATLTNLRER